MTPIICDHELAWHSSICSVHNIVKSTILLERVLQNRPGAFSWKLSGHIWPELHHVHDTTYESIWYLALTKAGKKAECYDFRVKLSIVHQNVMLTSSTVDVRLYRRYRYRQLPNRQSTSSRSTICRKAIVALSWQRENVEIYQHDVLALKNTHNLYVLLPCSYLRTAAQEDMTIIPTPSHARATLEHDHLRQRL